MVIRIPPVEIPLIVPMATRILPVGTLPIALMAHRIPGVGIPPIAQTVHPTPPAETPPMVPTEAVPPFAEIRFTTRLRIIRMMIILIRTTISIAADTDVNYANKKSPVTHLTGDFLLQKVRSALKPETRYYV